MFALGRRTHLVSKHGEPLAASLRDVTCACGSKPSAGVWLGLRSGSRPRFEGRWACRRSCLQHALSERARRDFPPGLNAPSRLRHRVPLGLILLRRNVINAEQLQCALQLQTASGKRLGAILQEHFGVAEERITAAIGAQWGLSLLHLPEVETPVPQSLAPASVFANARCFPAEKSSDHLLLACADGPDPGLALVLERMHSFRVEFGIVASTEIEVRCRTSLVSSVPTERIHCPDRDVMIHEATELLCRLQPVESRLVRVGGQWWLRAWLEESANRPGGGDDVRDVIFSLQSEDRSSPAYSAKSLLTEQ